MNEFKENVSLNWSNDSIRLINTPSALAKSTYFYVEEIGFFKTDSNYYSERQYLNSYLIVYTLSGKGILKYKENTYNLYPGDLFFIDCMEYQYYATSSEENSWKFFWVHFNGSTSHGYYEQFAKYNSPIITLNSESSIPLMINDLITINLQKDIRTELISSKFVVNLLTEILLSTNINTASQWFIPESTHNIMLYIDKHFTKNITLDYLAKKYSINKFYLAKEFKKYIGLPPNEYIINLRINYSKELLKYSDFTVAEISLKVGIDNISHFINLFKNREEITPLTFRKKWQPKLK